MLEFTYRRKIFRIKEMIFGALSDIYGKGCDVVYMHSNDLSGNFLSDSTKNLIKQSQFTLVNDLAQDEEEIYSKISKNYRYEIRRAEKEGILYSIIDKSYTSLKDEIILFKQTYEKMFQTKGMNNRFNLKLVEEGLKKDNILITKAYSSTNERCFIYHAYLVDGQSAMLMYSTSTLADADDKELINMVGWANKYLHWKDMCYFKALDYKRYEWGGIGNPENLSGIAKFKKMFGGEVVCYNNYLKAVSPLGLIYLAIVKRRSVKWQ